MIVMGVSGSGKSTVGALVAGGLGARFLDGDDLHPAANKRKMRDGIALDDADREPWLRAIGEALRSRPPGSAVVVACSALKRSYRDLLRDYDPELVFVCLVATADVLRERLSARDHEFMSPSLLASQLGTLEPLGSDERGFEEAREARPSDVAAEILARLPEIAPAAAGLRKGA